MDLRENIVSNILYSHTLYSKTIFEHDQPTLDIFRPFIQKKFLPTRTTTCHSY